MPAPRRVEHDKGLLLLLEGGVKGFVSEVVHILRRRVLVPRQVARGVLWVGAAHGVRIGLSIGQDEARPLRN